MEDNLMRRILCDISVANGKMHDGITPPSPEEMREQMRNPENLLEFLALFGKAIGVCKSPYCNGVRNPNCVKCETAMETAKGECIVKQIRNLAQNYTKQPARKYRILKITSDARCIKHTCTLPGEFEKQQAEDIVKAYNSKEYKIEAV